MFLDTPPSKCHTIFAEESQVDYFRWFAGWLADYRAGKPRDVSIVLAGGERRGGKSFALLLCSVAAAIECPGVVHWVVSSSRPESDELDRTIREWIPPEWYRWYGNPRYHYRWVNGTVSNSISADDPDTLKRGRVDIAFVNEGQKIPILAISNTLGGTIDRGGLTMIAANPPRYLKGEWVIKLKESIDEKTLSGARFFSFSAKQNQQIDQTARSRVGSILATLDPKAAATDDEGAWLPVGDRAYPKFNRILNVAPFPDLGDVTGDYLHRKTGRAYPFVGGLDFQGNPHHAMAIVKIVAGADPEHPIYWFCDEVISEQSTEDDLIDDALDKGYTPESLMLIGDASGAWQDGRHQFHGRVSFDFFKARRFNIQPPQRPRGKDSTRSRNPAIEDRLGRMMQLMAAGRIMVDETRCPRLAEAFHDCPLKVINNKRKPYGVLSHITDAAGYAIWWLEPRPVDLTLRPVPEAFALANVRPQGPRVL